jgi:energy-coupling factor transporter transmembrane protein EcfT
MVFVIVMSVAVVVVLVIVVMVAMSTVSMGVSVFVVVVIVLMVMVVMVVIMIVIVTTVSVFAVIKSAFLASMHVGAFTSMEDPNLDHVEHETQAGNTKHPSAHNLRLREQPKSSLIDEPARHEPNSEDAENGSKDFHAVIAIRESVVGSPHANL